MRRFVGGQIYVTKNEDGAMAMAESGNIERGVAVGAKPHFEEIRHRAMKDAVVTLPVARRAAGETCDGCAPALWLVTSSQASTAMMAIEPRSK